MAKKKIQIHSPALLNKFKAINARKKAKRAAEKAAKTNKKATLATKLAARRAAVEAGLAAKKKGGGTRKKKKVWLPIAQITDRQLEGAMYHAWKGYTIARNQKDWKKLEYYTAGIDRIKTEMARRGMKDKRNKSMALPALGPRKEQGKLPRYADGVHFKKTPGSTLSIVKKNLTLSPISFFKK